MLTLLRLFKYSTAVYILQAVKKVLPCGVLAKLIIKVCFGFDNTK